MPAADKENMLVQLCDGSTVGYGLYGDPDGMPVLALHGAPACRLMFSIADEEARAQGVLIIAPDRPGYGLTPPDRDPALATRAQWLSRFVDALQLSRFRVLGISGGAPYAVALSALMPERISGLALVSPLGPVADYQNSPQGKTKPIAFLQRRFFLHISQDLWLTNPVAALLRQLIKRSPITVSGIGARISGGSDALLFARPEIRAFFASLLSEAFKQGSSGGTSDLAIYGRSWGIDAACITMPSIIWQGTEDGIVPLEASEYLASILPFCDYRPIKGEGHFWVLDHVGEVIKSITKLPA
ncbi:MAG: alpha/beta hydrolase [Hyphomicrobiaceae bacterium]